MANGKVTAVYVTKSDLPQEIKLQGDYYLFALPVERMAELITDEMIKEDACMNYIKQLATSTSWMNGIQFYFKPRYFYQ